MTWCWRAAAWVRDCGAAGMAAWSRFEVVGCDAGVKWAAARANLAALQPGPRRLQALVLKHTHANISQQLQYRHEGERYASAASGSGFPFRFPYTPVTITTTRRATPTPATPHRSIAAPTVAGRRRPTATNNPSPFPSSPCQTRPSNLSSSSPVSIRTPEERRTRRITRRCFVVSAGKRRSRRRRTCSIRTPEEARRTRQSATRHAQHHPGRRRRRWGGDERRRAGAAGARGPAQRAAEQEIRGAEERAVRGVCLGAALRATSPSPLHHHHHHHLQRRRRLRGDHARRAQRLRRGAQRETGRRRQRCRRRRQRLGRDAAGAHAGEAVLVVRPRGDQERVVADQAGVAGAAATGVREPPRRRGGGAAGGGPVQVRCRARAQGAQVHQPDRRRRRVARRRGPVRRARGERAAPPLQVWQMHRHEGCGLRRGAVRRAGPAEEHLRRQHQQGGAARVLGPNLRHQLRQPSPDVLRHGRQGRRRQDHRGGGQRDHLAERVDEQAVQGAGSGGGVRAADHGGAGLEQPGLHRAVQPRDAPPPGAEPVGPHRHHQQPQPKPDAEPEPPADGGAEPAAAVVPPRELLPRGQLAARVGAAPLAVRLRGAVRVEVRAVPPARRVRRDGVLRVRRQGRRRDAQVQHGADPAACVPEHRHLAPQPVCGGVPRGALRRQPQLPQGDRRGHRRRRGAAHHLPPDLRLPAAAPRHRRGVRAPGAVLRDAAPRQLLVVREGDGGVDGAGDAGADGLRVRPRDAVVPARPDPAARSDEPAHRVQRVLVLAPPVRGRVRAAHRARALPLPDAQVVQEVDVDVPRRAHGPVRLRTAHARAQVQRPPRQDPQGRRVPRERPLAALLQAAGVPVQERPVHLRQLRRRLAVPVAPVLHHVGPAGQLRERPHQNAGRLDPRAQERLLQGVPAAGGGQERAAPGGVRSRRRHHVQPELPEGANRRALRRAGAGLQAVRRGAAGGSRDRRDADDLHHQGHHQQHEAAGRRPGVRLRRRHLRARVVPDAASLLLLGNAGAGLVRVVPRRDGRGGGDGPKGRHRALQLLHQRLRGGRRTVRAHRHAPVAQPRQARRRRRLRHPRQDALRETQLAQRLQAHRAQPPRPARRSVLLRRSGADQGAARPRAGFLEEDQHEVRLPQGELLVSCNRETQASATSFSSSVHNVLILYLERMCIIVYGSMYVEKD